MLDNVSSYSNGRMRIDDSNGLAWTRVWLLLRSALPRIVLIHRRSSGLVHRSYSQRFAPS
jgi:hypothetical protein